MDIKASHDTPSLASVFYDSCNWYDGLHNLCYCVPPLSHVQTAHDKQHDARAIRVTCKSHLLYICSLSVVNNLAPAHAEPTSSQFTHIYRPTDQVEEEFKLRRLQDEHWTLTLLHTCGCSNLWNLDLDFIHVHLYQTVDFGSIVKIIFVDEYYLVVTGRLICSQ